MYGKVIGKSIAVDCFEEVTKNGIYFLSEGNITSPLPLHVDRVYTSSHNSWLLRTKCKVDPDKIVSLPINQKFSIQDKVKKLDFYVTLLDAKQKPGAVMFLFEGEGIGNILYAGKCCYTDSFSCKPLTNFLKVKLVDYLYVHAACEDCHSHSMSTSAAIEDIINIIRWNPTCKIIVNEPYFREDILVDLRNRLQKPVSVSPNIMRHLEELGLGSDFQLDRTTAQVHVTDRSIGKLKHVDQPVFKIILVPCSMKLSSQEIQVKLYNLEKRGYHVLFYRNHCSSAELVNLVHTVNARHTVLLRPLPPDRNPAERPKDIQYWAHIGNVRRVFELLDRIDEQTRNNNTDDPVEVEIMEINENPSNVLMTKDKTVDLDSTIILDSEVVSIESEDTAVNTPRV